MRHGFIEMALLGALALAMSLAGIGHAQTMGEYGAVTSSAGSSAGGFGAGVGSGTSQDLDSAFTQMDAQFQQADAQFQAQFDKNQGSVDAGDAFSGPDPFGQDSNSQ